MAAGYHAYGQSFKMPPPMTRRDQGGQNNRRFSHVAVPKNNSDPDSDTDVPRPRRPPIRRSNRLKDMDNEDFYQSRDMQIIPEDAPLKGVSSSVGEVGKNKAATQGGKEEDEKGKEYFIQGMCDIVDIRIDNLRPAERQYSERDFLDQELSGDEEWNGDDALPGGTGYAW